MATTDFSALSDDDLFAQLPARTPAPAAAPSTPAAPSASPVSATTPAPAPAGAATPDYAKMSDDELFAGLAPRISAPATPQRSGTEQAGRAVGVGTRGLVQGLVDLPAMVTDNLIAKPINAGLNAVMGEGQGPRLKMLGESTGDLLTRAGLPQPETAQERVIQDINRGGASAAAGVLTGTGLAKSANAVTQAVGKTLSAAPGTQVVSGATGGGATGVTREGGGGEGAQLAAGLAGSLAPSVLPFAGKSIVRGALRGGEANRQQMVDNIATFESATGTTPTLGQATQSRGLQAAETGLSNVIGGSGLMARRAEAQSKALEDSVQKLSAELAPNATGWGAGEAITKGVQAFKDGIKTTQKSLYGQLDQHIPADAPVSVTRTQEALKSLNEGIDGAPNISQFFKNAKLGSIERAMLRDIDAATAANVPAGMASTGVAPTAGQLPYQAIQKLRTLVGQEISENSLTSDVPRSKWRALYGALSDDLGTAAKAAGPQAEQAWSRANQYTRGSMQRLDQLESIVNREAPERVFKAATSGLSDGGTQIHRLMKSMPEENRREVAAAVLQRLGRARNSAQNEMGDAFSSETFLTNLAAMSGPARMALFANSGFPGLRGKVEQLGKVAANRREGSQVFANPSGTARQLGLGAWASTLFGGLASGNAMMISGALATPVVANSLARAATSGKVVKSLARRTEINPAVDPALAAAALRPLQEREDR